MGFGHHERAPGAASRVELEAERVPGWVGINPEVGLVAGQAGGTERKDPLFSSVNVIDLHV